MHTMSTRSGFSLLEIMATIIIAATVAMIGVQYLRPSGDNGKQRSCDLTRELLQNDLQRYLEATGMLPSANLNELISDQYSGMVLPTCPVTGQSFSMDNSGVVGCPTHEPTRLK